MAVKCARWGGWGVGGGGETSIAGDGGQLRVGWWGEGGEEGGGGGVAKPV